MIIGTSEVDITPRPGVELSGYAARIQPSTGVLDPLFAKVIYLISGSEKLLWIHCDLIGFDRTIVQRVRKWAHIELALVENQVMLSATHTHAGACTIHLREAGDYDGVYVEFLFQQIKKAVRHALQHTEKCWVVTVEGHLDLAVDRRKKASAHTDPRVAALGFRRENGAFVAAIVNYAMHPVALGPDNRLISTDTCGQAALELARRLPGNPVVLAANGACANLNPPSKNVTFAQVQAWGGMIAAAVADLLRAAKASDHCKLKVSSRIMPLPLEVLDANGINQFADQSLRDADFVAHWGDKYRRVVEHWRWTLLNRAKNSDDGYQQAELFGVRISDVILVGANAELFSEFADMLRRDNGGKIYVIGYANGDFGYLSTRAAYAEGGYEVDVAHLFYGGFRPQVGGLELLATAADELVASLREAPKSKSKLNQSLPARPTAKSAG